MVAGELAELGHSPGLQVTQGIAHAHLGRRRISGPPRRPLVQPTADRPQHGQGQTIALQSMGKDFAIGARIEIEHFVVFGNVQTQVAAQHVLHHQPRSHAVARPMVVDQRDVVRGRTRFDQAETERPAARPLEGAIQRPRQMSHQALLDRPIAANHLNLGRVVRFVSIPKAVGIELAQAYPVMREGLFNGFAQGEQVGRPGQLIGVDGVVRVQLAPLQHDALERVQPAHRGAAWQIIDFNSQCSDDAPFAALRFCTFHANGFAAQSARLEWADRQLY